MGMNNRDSRVQAMAADPLTGCNTSATAAARQVCRRPELIVAALQGPVCLPW